MNPEDVLPCLSDPSPCFLCRRVGEGRSSAIYRVPVVHRELRNFLYSRPNMKAGLMALEKLSGLDSTIQLRALLKKGTGFGLMVSRRLMESKDTLTPGSLEAQEVAGDVLVFPPAEWAKVRTEFADWQFDGVEAAFEGLPYTFDDVLLFAGTNFSPDRWFLVLRGPMAGAVCWWTHDGDSVMSEPWATDLKAWGERVLSDAVDAIGEDGSWFGGLDSIDKAPKKAKLCAVEYRRETPEKV